MDSLTGIRVIDLTNAIAGSSATRLLSDLGAEVIKIERPDGGDFTRSLMPFVFQAHNRNKRSVTADLRTPQGLALLQHLVKDADVFVQTLRPGVAAKLGFDRETLTRLNPRLIYASFSAFNPQGPSALRRGVDAVAQAESGMVPMQGSLLGNLAYVDTASGLSLSYAILSALIKRERCGEIDSVEVNLFDTALYMQSAPLAQFSVTGIAPDQQSYLESYPVVGVFSASDGQFQISAYYQRDWVAVCQIVDREDLLEDPRFSEASQRQRHLEELRAILAGQFAERPRRYWVDQFTAHGILCGQVRDYGEVLEHIEGGPSRPEHIQVAACKEGAFVRVPFRFNGNLPPDTRPAPQLGADTDAVLAEAGFTSSQIDELRRLGIIGS